MTCAWEGEVTGATTERWRFVVKEVVRGGLERMRWEAVVEEGNEEMDEGRDSRRGMRRA